jgi:hypothetical protein
VADGGVILTIGNSLNKDGKKKEKENNQTNPNNTVIRMGNERARERTKRRARRVAAGNCRLADSKNTRLKLSLFPP